MKATSRFCRVILLLPLLFLACTVLTVPAQKTPSALVILSRDEAGTLLPATVFYRGQIAPIQARNSAGLRFENSKLVLAAMVDTSGYASSVQQTYQAYLITEVPLQIGEGRLGPGVYGFGFVAGNHMVAMDVGGNQVLTVNTFVDAQLTRPTPLQILPDSTSPARYRLYIGRSYVILKTQKQ